MFAIEKIPPPDFKVDSAPLAYLTAPFFQALYGTPDCSTRTLDDRRGLNWDKLMSGVIEAWQIGGTQGEGVVVAVIDTGIDFNHVDLRDNILTGYNFTTGDRMDYTDRAGHSTHVCGIIAATLNDVGVTGISPLAKLLVVKVLGDDGSGSGDWVAAGIRYAVDQKVDVINLSLGCQAPYEPIKIEVRRALEAGILVICAAGNDFVAGTNSVDWPARYNSDPDINGAITVVSAVDKYGSHAYFSSGGPSQIIAAPGVDIYSTFPNNSYAVLSGTCLTGETEVLTGMGLKSIEDITKDDVIYTFDPISKQLLKQQSGGMLFRGRNIVYSLETWNHQIEATENHPFLVITRDSRKKSWCYSLEWRSLKDIKVGDRIVTVSKAVDQGEPFRLPYMLQTKYFKLSSVGKNKVKSVTGRWAKFKGNNKAYERLRNRFCSRFDLWKESFEVLNLKLDADIDLVEIQRSNLLSFPQETTVDFCKFFGFMVGDGCAVSSTSVGIFIAEKADSSIVKEYTSIFSRIFSNKLRGKNGPAFYSKDIYWFFKMCGLKQFSHNKIIPDWVFGLPKDQRWAFISGYIDSDGNVRNQSKNKLQLRFSCASESLMRRLKSLFSSLGVVTSNVKKTRVKLKSGKDAEYYGFTVGRVYDFFNELDSVRVRKFHAQCSAGLKGRRVSHKRYKRVLGYQGCSAEIVRRIAPVGVRNVYDVVNIRDTHNFIANGIVAHNSMSCPIISGFAALTKSKFKKEGRTINGLEFNRLLAKSAKDLGSTGHDVDYGFGLVQGGELLKEAIFEEQDTTTTGPVVITPSNIGPPIAKVIKLF